MPQHLILISLSLICFVALSWAVFMLKQGILLWVSVLLIVVVSGIVLVACSLHDDSLEQNPAIQEDSILINFNYSSLSETGQLAIIFLFLGWSLINITSFYVSLKK